MDSCDLRSKLERCSYWPWSHVAAFSPLGSDSREYDYEGSAQPRWEKGVVVFSRGKADVVPLHR